ncbi:unnamed protein product [Effrenium voratum]|nr:unnamed protein product [Effrenium voratum]
MVIASDVAKFAATTPERASCWETDAPVFILGADGQTHETRPTTSLAQDLDKRGAKPWKAVARMARRREADERPIAPAEAPDGASLSARRSSQARPTERRGLWKGRLSFADRPLSGFGGSSPSFQQRRSIGGYENTAPAPCSRRSSTGSVKSPAERSERSERSVRQSRTSYEPVEKLLSLGIDKEAARVALAAVGGDVEKAKRLVLEDSQAHVSREACEWEFEGDKGWVPFDVDSDRTLRSALERRKEACELRFNGHRYIIDFNSMTQLNLATQRTRQIRRRGTTSAASSSGVPSAHERSRAR